MITFEMLFTICTQRPPFESKKSIKIKELIFTRNWDEIRRLIKVYSLSGEKVWSKGYDLLDNAAKWRDSRVTKLLVSLFSTLSPLIEMYDNFYFLQFIFYYAIGTKDRLLIDQIVAVGVNVNHQFNGEFPLGCAIRTKAGLDIIRCIIDQGACVNTSMGRFPFLNPLGHVIAHPPSDLDMAELLFSHGANVNHYLEPLSKSLVHLACDARNIEGLQWLLNHNADPNVQDKNGETGLHIAVRQGNLCSVKALVEYGASPNIFNKIDETSLTIAVETNNTEIAKQLFQHEAEIFNTPLSKAFRRNTIDNFGPNDVSAQREMFDILTKHGFVLNISLKNDPEFIHAAARNGHFQIVKKYLEEGGSPNSIFENTPLLYTAIKGGNKDLVEILLNYESDTFHEDYSNVSALTTSVSSNLVEITELLLSKGHKKFSQSCIFIAAENLNLDILKVLIKFKVKVISRNRRGFSPLHYAIASKMHVSQLLEDIDLEKTEIVRFLLNHGARVDSWPNAESSKHPIFCAISLNYVQVVKVLLEARASLNCFMEIGGNLFKSTLLHFAIKYNSNEMVKVLLGKGVPVDALQYDGKTPIEIAVESWAWNVLIVLLENGANVTGRSKFNKSLLSNAIERNCPSEVVSSLLKFGADVHRRDNQGRTALHTACLFENGDVVALLLDFGADVSARDNKKNTPFMVLKETSLTIRIVAQGNWYGYEHGEATAGPTTPIYHLQRHAFKMNFVGIPLPPCFKPVLELQYSEDLVISCKKEVKAMKTQKIDGSCLHLYDIIKQKQDPAYASNKSVLIELESNDDLLENFTLYRGIVKDCIRKAKIRNLLLDIAQTKLSGILNSSSQTSLPNEVIREIISYLTNIQLNRFLLK